MRAIRRISGLEQTKNFKKMYTTTILLTSPFCFSGSQDGKKIGDMFERNGPYYFDTDVSYNVALQSSTFAFQDHCRLGHPTLSSLKKLVPLCQSQSLSTLPCEVCTLSKRCCTSFYLHAENRVSRPFQLVHLDILESDTCQVIFRFLVFFCFC